MRNAHIVVYAGRGSSHSWTWLADLFESNSILSVRFLCSEEFISNVEEGALDMVFISGGDGFVIANTLKGRGFAALERHISKGGSYVGICAGAYLPLPSSVPPFSQFNLSTTKIENISCDSSFNDRSPREAVPYGGCAIVHPIRGPIRLISMHGEALVAPLYGGPIFKDPTGDQVLLRYDALRPETEIQIGKSNAESMLVGRPAVIRVAYGRGELLLSGPHLEHPRYPQANEHLLDLLGLKAESGHLEPRPTKPRDKSSNLLSAISDLKVAILGLENRSYTVGHKAWDGGRFLELVLAIEKRTSTLSDHDSEEIQSSLERARELMVSMKVGHDSDADETSVLLVEAARLSVDSHFAALRSGSGRLA